MRLQRRRPLLLRGVPGQDAMVRILYGKIAYLEKALKESAQLTRH